MLFRMLESAGVHVLLVVALTNTILIHLISPLEFVVTMAICPMTWPLQKLTVHVTGIWCRVI